MVKLMLRNPKNQYGSMTYRNPWPLIKLVLKFLGYLYLIYFMAAAGWANLTGKDSFTIRSPLPPFEKIHCQSGNIYLEHMH